MAYQEQQVVLAAAQQHEALLQQQAQNQQQELEQLRAEARNSGQYSDLQRQFQEVLCQSVYIRHKSTSASSDSSPTHSSGCIPEQSYQGANVCCCCFAYEGLM